MLVKLIRIILPVLAILVVVLTVVVKIRRAAWSDEQFRESKEAFFSGSIGTEIMPEPVLRALPAITPEFFQPRGEANGDWIDQFGFIRSPDDPELPLGFTISRYRPKSGSPSPVNFVGIGCVTCHSTEIRIPGSDEPRFFPGPGSYSLNMFSFIEAVRSSVLDPRVTVAAVSEHHEERAGEPLDLEKSLMVRLWLGAARSRFDEDRSRYGDPFGGELSLDPNYVPTGPSRTQPFRTLVRSLLDRPGGEMAVYTKLASVYHQDRQVWAQVDGSIRDLNARSSLAAYAAGATFVNMAVPEIEHNIRKASDYTRDLAGPRWEEVFTGEKYAIDDESADRGKAIYRRECFRCHGGPAEGGDEWEAGSEQDEVVPAETVGTDSERVSYRYFESLPDRIFEELPSYHPFSFPREDLRPGPAGGVAGYLNEPLDSLFTRAPYLHNGSVPTLAELIHLEERRDVFYRGRHEYDVERVGLAVPAQPTDEAYFRFDTATRGNANTGHDYPWAFDDPDRDEEALRDLLEYLKTL